MCVTDGSFFRGRIAGFRTYGLATNRRDCSVEVKVQRLSFVPVSSLGLVSICRTFTHVVLMDGQAIRPFTDSPKPFVVAITRTQVASVTQFDLLTCPDPQSVLDDVTDVWNVDSALRPHASLTASEVELV